MEFALVAPLVLLVALAVLQLALALHARATLTAAAAEGARVAALSGAGPAEGVRRTRSVLAGNLAGDLVTDVTASRDTLDGAPILTVRVAARLPLLGLFGPAAMVVEGHAWAEPQ